MTEKIEETQLWIENTEFCKMLEERGEARGRLELSKEIALKMFRQRDEGIPYGIITRQLMYLGIPNDIIEAAGDQYSIERFA